MNTSSKRGRPHGSKERVSSDALKRLREAMGMTQQQLAGHLGCSMSLISQCERRVEVPARGELGEEFLRLCKKHKIDVP